MKIDNYIWIFSGAGGKFPGGVFSELSKAENWIQENSLSGVLTKYPINQGVFEWAIENQAHSLSQEKLEEKRSDPKFIGSFTSASQEHYHYENGKRD